MTVHNAVIYDLDGVLIDSEPYWRKSEIEVFNRLNVPLTHKMCSETVGLRIDEAVSYWHRKYPWSLEQHPVSSVVEDIMELMEQFVSTQGKAMSGVYDSLEYFNDLRVPMAIASSSQLSLIECAVERLNIKKHFQALCSAEHCAQGKPDPEVYLSAAKELGVRPQECVALEDSLNGIKAAKAAGMLCVAIPEKKNRPKDLSLADYVIENIAEVEKLQLF